MRNLVYIFILVTKLNCYAQFNLVPNSSFENYTSCPASSPNLTLSVGWINPTSAGSPDYYHACSPFLSVPYCSPSGNCFQYAKTGSGYAGLYAYDKTTLNLREYAQIQFLSPLTNGKCYFVGFYSNLHNAMGKACNNLGAYLSNTAISLTGPSYLLNYSSQIKGFNNKVLKDTLSWNLICGIFQATSNEKYITIGNFNTDNTTDTLTFNSTAAAPNYAYYFIDDIFVIPIDSIPGGMPAFAGNNVTINSGDSTFIGQQISNLNCNWYNGTVQIASNISGIYVQPTVTTTYVVQQNLCGNITTDTVVVTVLPNGVDELRIKNDELRISPNPSEGIFTMEILNPRFKFENAEIKIIGVLGKEIKGEKLISKKQKIDISELSAGMYYLQLVDAGKVLCTKKIIKQ